MKKFIYLIFGMRPEQNRKEKVLTVTMTLVIFLAFGLISTVAEHFSWQMVILYLIVYLLIVWRLGKALKRERDRRINAS